MGRLIQYSKLLLAISLLSHLCGQATIVQAQRTAISIASQPEPAANSSGVASNASAAQNSSAPTLSASGARQSGNATITGGTNSTNTTNSNATSFGPTSTPDPTKPFATDFKTNTQMAPGPAAPGGGNVAQSPDDSVSGCYLNTRRTSLSCH